MTRAEPYGRLQFATVNGKRMAYIDEGQGDTIVFQHGNPTSSYLWRNVMPHLEGLGRLVACDLIGMGGSDKLDGSGPDRYHYREHRDYLFALWDALDLGDRVTLVLHDWGSALGFDWANQNRGRVAGIAHMEAIALPMDWELFPESERALLQGFRSPDGEALVLDDNMFVEAVLPGAVQRTLSDAEMDHYRQPFRTPGEDRRPTLSWPRNIPIGGEPADVVALVEEYGTWLAGSDVPKLFVNADPGFVTRGRVRDFVRSWPNQIEVTVPGVHFVQEDSPDEIGRAVGSFVRAIRAPVIAGATPIVCAPRATPQPGRTPTGYRPGADSDSSGATDLGV
jgi:haloalkane dehalogenase